MGNNVRSLHMWLLQARGAAGLHLDAHRLRAPLAVVSQDNKVGDVFNLWGTTLLKPWTKTMLFELLNFFNYPYARAKGAPPPINSKVSFSYSQHDLCLG